MNFSIVYVVALFGAVNAGIFSHHQTTEHDNHATSYSSVGSSGLRAIAQGSAQQTHNIFSQQHAAARQASYVAKNTLAQAAAQAAATAQAALAGKSVLLENLEHQYAGAARVLDSELAQLHLAEASALSAQATVQTAQHQVNVLGRVLNGAQGLLETAQGSAAAAAADLASQTEMVAKAKARVEALQAKLHSVHEDFAATKEAAEQASASAQSAQSNAAAAAENASHILESAVTEKEHKAYAFSGFSWNSMNDIKQFH